MNIDIAAAAAAFSGEVISPEVVYSFSPSTGGFYPSDTEYPNLPSDLIELTLDQYNTLKDRPSGTVLAVEDGVVKVVAAPPPPPPTAEQVLGRRNTLLGEAALRIDPLKDAVDLGDATPDEEALYTAWRQYRVKLMRIEQQPGFPASVDWPKAPA